MDITTMTIEANSSGRCTVKLSCKCHSAPDLDDVIAWLNLARSMMDAWHNHRVDPEPSPTEETVEVDLADVFGYGPSAPGWLEPAPKPSPRTLDNNPKKDHPAARCLEANR
jgi:hypothetical protein